MHGLGYATQGGNQTGRTEVGVAALAAAIGPGHRGGGRVGGARRDERLLGRAINQADWPELAELPEIGPTLARRIVESRESAGPFADHEDLRRVRGIGPLTLERMRPYLLPMPVSGAVAGAGDEQRGKL
jgi:competence protein ComEA